MEQHQPDPVSLRAAVLGLRAQLDDLHGYLDRPTPHPTPEQQATALVRAGRMVADVLIVGLAVADRLDVVAQRLVLLSWVLAGLVLVQALGVGLLLTWGP